MLQLGQYRGDQDAANHDPLYDVPIHRFDSIEEVSFDLTQPVRYLIRDDRYTLPIDILLYPKAGSRLLVGFHGAEDRRTFDPPKFQFIRSFSTRDEPMLFISDTTVLQSEKINIGWCAGNRDTPLAFLLAQAVQAAGAALGVDETVLVGHSAGGFSAILVGSQVPNSRAISVNGQTVVIKYEPWTVKNLHEAAFPECATVDEMAERYADRLDLRIALRDRLPSTSFTYFGNRTDQATFGRLPHFPLLAESLGLDELGGTTAHGDAFVACEWVSPSPSGHALPGTMLPFIAMTLGEPHTLDITHETDPRWIH